MGTFVDPLLALDGCETAEQEAHELAHFLQLVTNSSGMLFLWGWAIVLKTAQMIRKEITTTECADAFCLPLTALPLEDLPVRAAALVEKLAEYLEILERYEGPAYCASAFPPREERGTETCPWLPNAVSGLAAPLGGAGLREALSVLLAEKATQTDAEGFVDTLCDTNSLSPSAVPLSWLVEQLGPKVPSEFAIALIDLALMAPPDPGHTSTPFGELHPGSRFLKIVDWSLNNHWRKLWSVNGYEKFLSQLEEDLGWSSWRENTQGMLSRIASQLRKPGIRQTRPKTEEDHRAMLARLAETGGRWRLRNPGVFLGPPEIWLKFARDLAPLASMTDLWDGEETGDTAAVRSHVVHASLHHQMVTSDRVQCIYHLSRTWERCSSFLTEARCAKFPNPPSDAVDCGFSRRWLQHWGLPAEFPTAQRQFGCLRCFGKPKIPSQYRSRYVESLQPELPPDHLAAAYGGDGFFNPCLALVQLPAGDDPFAEINRRHELLHGSLSACTLGRAMFLARFLTLALWYRWTWGEVRSPPELVSQVTGRLESFVGFLQREWLAAQEGVAWRETSQLLAQLAAAKPEHADEARSRMRMMNEVVTLGPNDHPLVRGWWWGQRLEDRYGTGAYRAVVRAFCDPDIPVVEHSLEAWLDATQDRAQTVLDGVPRLVRANLGRADGAASEEFGLQIRREILGDEFYSASTRKTTMWRQVVFSLFGCSSLPTELSAFLDRVLLDIESDPSPRLFTRFAYDIESVQSGTDGLPRIALHRATEERDVRIEREVNFLAAIDAIRLQFADDPARIRDRIRVVVPDGETFATLFTDLIPIRVPEGLRLDGRG
jgi:hypothetical protein